MRKIKVFITVFLLYEFVMLTILQVPSYCTSVFNFNFCNIHNFKYFLLCIMLPILFGLFVWWMPDIAHSFCRNKCDLPKEPEPTIKSIFNDIVSKQEVERLIIAVIVMGIQKIIANHPTAKKTLKNITDIIKKADKA